MSSILVVEDDAQLRENLLASLRSHGYTAEGLPDARSLVDVVRAEQPELVILDVMLPLVDGMTACRELRIAGLTQPVLMLSARSSELDKIVGLESGADDYVTKPFSTGELIARVRALLRRTETTQRTTLEAADLNMDLIGRRAHLDQEELKLTHKEFDLLAELIRNTGMVLSRDLLLEKIWGYDFLGDSRTVDVHIRWLRQKIEADPSEPARIITVRGLGYRFDG